MENLSSVGGAVCLPVNLTRDPGGERGWPQGWEDHSFQEGKLYMSLQHKRTRSVLLIRCLGTNLAKYDPFPHSSRTIRVHRYLFMHSFIQAINIYRVALLCEGICGNLSEIVLREAKKMYRL